MYPPSLRSVPRVVCPEMPETTIVVSGNAQKLLDQSEDQKWPELMTKTFSGLVSTSMNVFTKFKINPLSGLSGNTQKTQKCDRRMNKRTRGEMDRQALAHSYSLRQLHCGGPVSDLKLNEIQANRACNFVNFQARLESSKPHKLLCQQVIANVFEIPHFNNVDNPKLQHASWIWSSSAYGYF